MVGQPVYTYSQLFELLSERARLLNGDPNGPCDHEASLLQQVMAEVDAGLPNVFDFDEADAAAERLDEYLDTIEKTSATLGFGPVAREQLIIMADQESYTAFRHDHLPLAARLASVFGEARAVQTKAKLTISEDATSSAEPVVGVQEIIQAPFPFINDDGDPCFVLIPEGGRTIFHLPLTELARGVYESLPPERQTLTAESGEDNRFSLFLGSDNEVYLRGYELSGEYLYELGSVRIADEDLLGFAQQFTEQQQPENAMFDGLFRLFDLQPDDNLGPQDSPGFGDPAFDQPQPGQPPQFYDGFDPWMPVVPQRVPQGPI